MKYRTAYIASSVASLLGFWMYKSFKGPPCRLGGLLMLIGVPAFVITRIAQSVAELHDAEKTASSTSNSEDR